VDVLGSIRRCLLRNDAGRCFQHETAHKEQCSRAGPLRQVLRVVQGAGGEGTGELAQITPILAATQLQLRPPLLAYCLPWAVSVGTKLAFLCYQPFGFLVWELAY